MDHFFLLSACKEPVVLFERYQANVLVSYERRYLWVSPAARVKTLLAFWDFSRFSVHGDTQAVFEFDPPQSLLDEIEEADNETVSLDHGGMGLHANSGAKPPLKRSKTRTDSMAGVTEHLSDFFHDHGGGDIPGRLEALEEATKRIEVLLARIGQTMGDDSSDSDTPPHRISTHDADAEV